MLIGLLHKSSSAEELAWVYVLEECLVIAQKLAVEFNLSWPSTQPGFCMWWVCTTALPKHRLLTAVAKLLMQYCNTGSLDPVQIDIPFYIQSSIACILLNRGPNGSALCVMSV